MTRQTVVINWGSRDRCSVLGKKLGILSLLHTYSHKISKDGRSVTAYHQQVAFCSDIKVELYLYRPWVSTKDFREVKTPKIFRQSARESDNVVGPMHRPSLPPGNIPGTYFC